MATHQVLVSRDCCANYSISLPQSKGTEAECLNFISKHLPPRGYEFDVLDLSSGRLCSFFYTPVARRKRLSMQDLSLRN